MMITFLLCAVSPLIALLPNSAPRRPGPISLVKLAGGDTLVYKADWGKGARATSYVYSVRSSKAGWTLPTQVISPDTTETFKLINPTWDSTTFRLVVWSKNGTVRSVDSAYVSWSVIRRPSAPGPIIVDSSSTVIGIDIKPDSVKIVFLATQQFCAFPKYLDGKYKVLDAQLNITYCKAWYDKYPTTQRGIGYPVAMAQAGYNHFEFQLIYDTTANKEYVKPRMLYRLASGPPVMVANR